MANDDLRLFSSAEISLAQQLNLETLSRGFEQADQAEQYAMFRSLLFDWQRKQNMLSHVLTEKLGFTDLPRIPRPPIS